MTIVVAHNGVMVADGGAYCGNRKVRMAFAKIRRTKAGGLCACAGSEDDCFVFGRWSEAGFPAGDIPKLTEGPDGFSALVIDPDGSVWVHYAPERRHPVVQPAFIGETTAINMVHGMMLAGMDAEAAVRLATEHCVWIDAPVQVERLHPATKSAAA
jgi:hypothetical protein